MSGGDRFLSWLTTRQLAVACRFYSTSGSLSTRYFPLLTLISGTPGIFLILLLRSRSLVATKYTRCFVTRLTMQSSAYVPLWLHVSRSHRSSLVMRSAIEYRFPSFSISANTQSVIATLHLVYNKSMKVDSISSFAWTLCDMKFVSTRMLYGGPNAQLCEKKSEEGCWGMTWTSSSPFVVADNVSSRASRLLMVLFT